MTPAQLEERRQRLNIMECDCRMARGRERMAQAEAERTATHVQCTNYDECNQLVEKKYLDEALCEVTRKPYCERCGVNYGGMWFSPQGLISHLGELDRMDEQFPGWRNARPDAVDRLLAAERERAA